MKRIKTDIDSQRVAAIHFAKSLEKATAQPKLVKEYAFPNALYDSQEEGSAGYNILYSA